MPCTCDIEFENNSRKIYYAGQLLRGTVRLNLTKQITVRSMYVRISGKAFASWIPDRRKVEDEEKYLDKRFYLIKETIGTYILFYII